MSACVCAVYVQFIKVLRLISRYKSIVHSKFKKLIFRFKRVYLFSSFRKVSSPNKTDLKNGYNV